jgi:hypothetical protein
VAAVPSRLVCVRQMPWHQPPCLLCLLQGRCIAAGSLLAVAWPVPVKLRKLVIGQLAVSQSHFGRRSSHSGTEQEQELDVLVEHGVDRSKKAVCNVHLLLTAPLDAVGTGEAVYIAVIIIIIIPCKPYLSASATAPHPLGRRKVERLFSLFSV